MRNPYTISYHRGYVITLSPHGQSWWAAHFHPDTDAMAVECVLGSTPAEAWSRALHTIDHELPLPCPGCGDPRPGVIWLRTGLDTEAEVQCPHCRGEGIVWGVKARERVRLELGDGAP